MIMSQIPYFSQKIVLNANHLLNVISQLAYLNSFVAVSVEIYKITILIAKINLQICHHPLVT